MASTEQAPVRLPRAFFGALYFSEGAPIGFLWWALPTLLRERGVDVAAITTLTAILVIPWTLKFLWAPMVDVWQRRGGGLKVWVVVCQLGMGLALIPAAYLEPVDGFFLLGVCLFAHAFMAATQDVAIDAWAIRSVAPGERGLLNGWMQAGMLVGRSGFGGGGIVLAHVYGWQTAVLLLVAAIWSTLALVLLARAPVPLKVEKGSTPVRDTFRNLARVSRQRSTWLGLMFALTAGAGFEAAGALAGPMLVDAGVESPVIGAFFGIPVVIAMLLGGLSGGLWSDRRNARSGAIIGLMWITVGVFAVAGLHQWAGDGLGHLLLGVLSLMYFGIGVFTASSYALFMDLTDPRLGATQFSAFMAATNGCEAWAGAAGGRFASNLGYAAALLIMGAISLLGLVPLGKIKSECRA